LHQAPYQAVYIQIDQPRRIVMQTAHVKYPNLSGEQLTKLQRLEREIGRVVVAVEPQTTTAELNQDELRRLQEVEREMGLILLAYDKVNGR